VLEGELEKVKRTEADNPTSSLNQRLHALYRASTVALKVSTGEEGRRSLGLVSFPFKLKQHADHQVQAFSCWWRARAFKATWRLWSMNRRRTST
jgi:hypothetical protein